MLELGMIAAARAVKPDMVICSWNGDVYERHLLADGVIDALRNCDVQLTVNARTLPRYAELGIRSLATVPISPAKTGIAQKSPPRMNATVTFDDSIDATNPIAIIIKPMSQ